jgi:hypothetical protein
VRNETNETEMGEIDLEAPFRFIRFFSVLSVTLARKDQSTIIL